MKGFDKIVAAFTSFYILIFLGVNIFLHTNNSDNMGLYRVEINRIAQEISNGNEVNTDSYETIAGVYKNQNNSFYDSENPYVIRKINGELYRIEYRSAKQNNKIIYLADIFLVICFLPILGVLLYIRQAIIRPFNMISKLPYQLSKGNLTVPLKETKTRYFGKFIWGLDMLREELGRSRQRELERAKNEKTAMLSISHDIKTPLAAIKLYAKAISSGLYSDKEKQRLAAESINDRADEIERYVNAMREKLSSDFMEFHAELKEIYLSLVLDRIRSYYSDKLRSLGTEYVISEYADCLLLCDPDRLEEVLQNIIENAVKYGDGKDICIELSDEEDCKLITVSNSGCTLPETELTHIFDSFWRGSNAGDREGNGLGLYICRRLMNEMNGDIFAEIRNDTMCLTVVCHKVL